MSVEQCRYMAAAYPALDAEDTCGSLEHRHDETTFALAHAFAAAVQQSDPTDEQVGWFIEDAAAIVDDFDPKPAEWTVTEPQGTDEVGLEFVLSVNGVGYVIQPSGKEEARPVSRTQWEAWQDEDCGHEWEVRPESDTRVCEWCGAER